MISLFKKTKKKAKQFFKSFYSKAIVFAYHRVMDLESDPQLLAVSIKNFEEQLKIISKHYRAIGLSELRENIEQRSVKDKSVVLTFDDGYLDNLLIAKPLLEKYEIPATVFVATGKIDDDQEFWWDELERLILLSERGGEIAFFAGGVSYKKLVEKLEPDELAKINAWNVLEKPYPSKRCDVYKDLHSIFFELAPSEQRRAVEQIKGSLGIHEKPRGTHRIVSLDDLKNVSSNKFVEIGSHTVNHVKLSSKLLADQKFEIEYSKKFLEETMGRSVTNFSYPFGTHRDIGDFASGIVKKIGYKAAVANFSGVVTRRSDKYMLTRFLIRNWSGGEFESKLESWFKA
jgi:peptidoglycan/xylan/chitin deacetylase (PgdA/CDA1 family)